MIKTVTGKLVRIMKKAVAALSLLTLLLCFSGCGMADEQIEAAESPQPQRKAALYREGS